MKSTKVQETIQRSLSLIGSKFPLLVPASKALQALGGAVFLVGGAVRDIILEKEIKDLDIEVHGISLRVLEKTLKQFGAVRLVGKAFGVIKIDGCSIDWAVPRRDSAGRFPEVVIDESLSLKDACRRRDLTMNAMMINLETGALEDFFNGIGDIENKVLRTPDPHFFVQDPLRFYRVMQFIGRFEMEPDLELNTLCEIMDISDLSRERVHDEFEKLFLQAVKPSLALQWLDDRGRLKTILPELYATKGVEQSPVHHPEGDVFEHSKQAVDAAAQFFYETAEKRLIMVLAALCHDLGKAVSSRVIDGVIRAHGHDLAGVPLAEALLDRLTCKQRLKKPILCLVRYHMSPLHFVKNNAGCAAYKRLASHLFPDASLRMVFQLSVCDAAGRNPQKGTPLAVVPGAIQEDFFNKAQECGVLDAPEKAVLVGDDLLGEGIEGVILGNLLKEAYTIQLEEGLKDKNELKKRVLKQR